MHALLLGLNQVVDSIQCVLTYIVDPTCGVFCISNQCGSCNIADTRGRIVRVGWGKSPQGRSKSPQGRAVSKSDPMLVNLDQILIKCS